MQVIRYRHPSHLNLIIKTLLKIKTKDNISNTDDIHLCVTSRNQNYSVQATYITTNFTPFNATLYLTSIKLHTTTKLPLTGKEHFCFLINKNIISGCQVCQVTRTSNIYQYQLEFFIMTKWFGFMVGICLKKDS